MKKLSIIFGIIILIVLLLLWIYLMVFGTPNGANELFSDLGFNEPTAERPLNNQVDQGSQPDISIESSVPYMISTKPTAGFVLTNNASNTALLYAEKGTGYIYEINFNSGEETRLSGTTIAKASEAIFNQSGSYVVLISESENSKEAVLLKISGVEDSANIVKLPTNVDDVFFFDDNSLRYTQINDNEKLAFNLDIPTGVTSPLWKTSLTETKVYWGNNFSYLVNKTAPYLKGAVYKITNGNLTSVLEQKYAFEAKIDVENNTILETYWDTKTGSFTTSIYNIDTKETDILSLPVIPEKCALLDSSLWCGSSFIAENKDRNVINDWYAGTINLPDFLWHTKDISVDASYLIFDFLDELGYQVDIENMTLSVDERFLIFTNKINDSLWIYRIPAVSQ